MCICDYNFSLKRDMKIHVASVHERVKPIKYDICDYSCSPKGIMKIHAASVHEEKKPIKCDIIHIPCLILYYIVIFFQDLLNIK